MSASGRVAGLLTLAVLLAPACGDAPVPDSIRIAVPFEVDTLDPHAEDKLSNQAVLYDNLYEPLASPDADMKMRPALAESWENPDSLTWVFHLRRGVTFHSGRPLRAADVVYSFQRLLRSRELQIRNYLATVDEVRALDEHTVLMRTMVPSRIFLNKISHVMIVPEESSSESLRRSADGTGPYVLAEWRPGESLRLRRRERHWGLPATALREAEFVLAQAPEQAIEGLLAGRYQLARCDSKKVEVAVERSGRHQVVRRNNLYVKYLAYDLARDVTPFCSARPNPFRDVRVRRVLDAGIDRHGLVRELWGYAVPATQPVPRFVFGFNPDIPETAYDPERARELLRAAGLQNGFKAALHARTIVADAAQIVREDLARIGIAAEVTILPDAEYFALLDRHGATFWLNRFGCATGDASDLFEYLAHSADRDRRFGTINYAGYSDSDLDRAIEASAGIEKPDDRRNALQELMGQVMDELLVIPLYNDQDVYAVEKRFAWEPRSDSYVRVTDIAVR